MLRGDMKMSIDDIPDVQKTAVRKKIHDKIKSVYLATDQYQRQATPEEAREMSNIYKLAVNFGVDDIIREKYAGFDAYATTTFKKAIR